MKIASIIGTRPQVIKLLPIQLELAKRNIDHVVIDTGQHFSPELSTELYTDLGLQNPNHRLSDGKSLSNSHSIQIAQMLSSIHNILKIEKPDKVIVYGDTNSTLAASLVCAKEGFNFVHIEAGLRSKDRSMPEEVNRVLVDNLANVNFTPTKTAHENLHNEGIGEKSIFVGDIMLDTYLMLKSKIEKVEPQARNLPSKYYLLTLHRPSNVDELARLEYILEKLNDLMEKIVFPAHPRTIKNLLHKQKSYENIIVIPPQSYISFAAILGNCSGLFTDSGGLQKEAFFQGIPTLTIRSSTEWPETLFSGHNILDYNLESLRLFTEQCNKGKYLVNFEQFGSGKARVKIIDFLLGS